MNIINLTDFISVWGFVIIGTTIKFFQLGLWLHSHLNLWCSQWSSIHRSSFYDLVLQNYGITTRCPKKKVGFTTCNSSSKSHFFLGHLVDYGWIKINKMNMSMIELIDQALSSILIRINLCQYAHCSIKITRQVYFSFMNSFRQSTKCSQTK